MTNRSEIHRLLILSQDYEAYHHLISEANLPSLTILAAGEINKALRISTGCDLLFGEPARVCQLVNNLPHLGWLQTTWAGVEPLMAPDLRRDYTLTNARNVYGPAMSEFVFGYLLAIERQIVSRWRSQQAGTWDDTTPGRVQGKLLGIVGVGSIGSRLAETARHFGIRVYGYTRLSETCPFVDRYFHRADRKEFACNLDYLVCTLPGTQNTKGMLDAGFLAELPHKAWLVNVGRGGTVDELALIEALSNRTIAGAVLDVFQQEPLPPSHPLWTTPNTYITFHTAARNYLPDIANLFIENYQRLIAGQPLLYQVDFEQGY